MEKTYYLVGVYHCDVKLENLGFRSQTSGLLTDGRLESALVLFDFGLSRFIGQKWDGKFSGTAIYTAPEILQEMRVVEECRSSASPNGGGERPAGRAELLAKRGCIGQMQTDPLVRRESSVKAP